MKWVSPARRALMGATSVILTVAVLAGCSRSSSSVIPQTPQQQWVQTVDSNMTGIASIQQYKTPPTRGSQSIGKAVCGEGCPPGGGPGGYNCDGFSGTCDYASSAFSTGMGSYEWFVDVVSNPTGPCDGSTDPVGCDYVNFGPYHAGLSILFVPSNAACVTESVANTLAAAAAMYYAALASYNALKANPEFDELMTKYAAGEIGAAAFLDGLVSFLGIVAVAALAATAGYTLYQIYQFIACAAFRGGH